MAIIKNNISLGQAADSIGKNVDFFDNNPIYRRYVQEFEVYKYSSLAINQTLNAGIEELLDIGNGGIINYDASKIRNITALDLFFDENQTPEYPNVKFKKGSALDIPFENERFDMVLMQNLLHHVIGKSVRESKEMMRKVLSESYRVLKPGGRLLIIESTVPSWFYSIETVLFSLFVRFNPLKHPATFQYTQEYIKEIAEQLGFSLLEYVNIPKGKYIIQLGFKFPSALTPVRILKLLLLKDAKKGFNSYDVSK